MFSVPQTEETQGRAAEHWVFPAKGHLTWPVGSLCPPTQKPTIDSYGDVGNSYRVLELVSCSPKDRWCQLWDQSEKVE